MTCHSSQLQQQNQQQHPPGTPHSRSGGRRSASVFLYLSPLITSSRYNSSCASRGRKLRAEVKRIFAADSMSSPPPHISCQSYQINPKPHEPVWAKTWVRKGFVSMGTRPKPLHVLHLIYQRCFLGAAWVVALKQRVKKFWEEARNLWNLASALSFRSNIP
jgi:hypothetical protein